MARIGIEQLVTTPSTLNYLSESAYDSTKWNVGNGLFYNPGSTPLEKYIAPMFDAVHPMEEGTAFAVLFSYVHNFSSTTDYIFGLENSAGATSTRRIMLWTLNKKTGARSWNGFITITLASATAHTARDFKIDVKNETTGTVTVSGTAVTGSSTSWTTNKVAVGARIGFGSTDPTQISTWYRVSAVGSNTGITLGTSGPTLASPTAYVIQEFRPVYLATNGTTTNGGIHYAKGVSIEDFTAGGTTIALSSATDDQKAVYWLKDASTQTNIVAAGMAMDRAAATATSLTAYVLDLVAAGSYKFYVYNLRAALTVSGGASTSAWTLATGNNAFSGTGSQNCNITIATTSHGTGSGVKSLYMTTTTRIYRVPVTQITTTSTTVFSSPSDNIIEVSPGGASTYAVTNALSTIEYIDDADVFLVGTTHTTALYSYVTQYVASGDAFTKMWGRDYKYLEQSLKDSNHPTIFSNQTTVAGYYANTGTNLLYATKQGTTISTNQIYIMAFGADWDYASSSSGRLISPEISTPNALKYYRCFANNTNYLGSTTLGKTTEPFRLYARTANITSDATSGWTLLDETNDLSSFAGASSIQFAIEFKTIGESCLPARIFGVNLSYEDNTTDSHYALSVAKSSLSSKIFAFWFKTAFGGTVPSLTITLYDADTGGVLLTDTTVAHANGTWEKTTDGSSWSSYDTSDRGNATTWIRYTPTSLSDNVKVAAYITQT